MKTLILNADDFAYSQAVNEGILELHQLGSISSASLLPNFPLASQSIQLARTQNLDLGWHLNFTEAKPISPPHLVSSLVDENGQFYSLKNFIIRLVTNKIKSNHLEKEMLAQWDFFCSHGYSPSHLDGHQHVHLFKPVAELIKNKSFLFKIKYLRISVESHFFPLKRVAVRLFLNSLTGASLHFWKNTFYKSLPFSGLSLAAHSGNLEHWRKCLSQIKENVCEVMLHPGKLDSEKELKNDDLRYKRQKEFEVLKSFKWKEMIEEMGFSVRSFREI